MQSDRSSTRAPSGSLNSGSKELLDDQKMMKIQWEGLSNSSTEQLHGYRHALGHSPRLSANAGIREGRRQLAGLDRI